MNIEFSRPWRSSRPIHPRAESCISTRWACRLAGRSTSTASGSLVASPLGSGRCLQAAKACFGTPRWPAERPVPQIGLEFDVGDAAAVDPAARSSSELATTAAATAREPWAEQSPGCNRRRARSSGSRTSLCSTTTTELGHDLLYGRDEHHEHSAFSLAMRRHEGRWALAGDDPARVAERIVAWRTRPERRRGSCRSTPIDPLQAECDAPRGGDSISKQPNQREALDGDDRRA